MIFCCVFCLSDRAAAHEITTNKQDQLQYIINTALSNNLSRDSDYVKHFQSLYEEEELNLNIVAKVIHNEANEYCEWLHRVAVGQVIYNRAFYSDWFPNTIYEVVNQHSSYTDENGVVHTLYQYSPNYTKNFDDVSESAYEIAKFVLDGKAVDTYVPRDVIWQAEFIQGKEVWKSFYVNTGYYSSTTYFCSGSSYGN